ncbi:MAG: AraC family transcriptional regulator [Cyanobacteria bacterium P01_H01_bin.21]
MIPPVYGRRFEGEHVFVELCPRQPYEVRYVPRWHILGFAPESQRGHHAFASDRVAAYHAPANTFAFTPAGCDTFSASAVGGEYLIFGISPELLDAHSADVAGKRSVELRRLSHLKDRHVTAIGRAARQFMQAQHSGRLYFESLAGQFATHVVLALLSKCEVKAQTRKLSSVELERLREFVESNLCEDLSLESLAAAVGMSSSCFARGFKLATGQSPHKWVMACRLARAKELLAKTNQPIVQIALDCGFSGQSHMTTVFSKALGVTPKCYRQLLA